MEIDNCYSFNPKIATVCCDYINFPRGQSLRKDYPHAQTPAFFHVVLQSQISKHPFVALTYMVILKKHTSNNGKECFAST